MVEILARLGILSKILVNLDFFLKFLAYFRVNANAKFLTPALHYALHNIMQFAFSKCSVTALATMYPSESLVVILSIISPVYCNFRKAEDEDSFDSYAAKASGISNDPTLQAVNSLIDRLSEMEKQLEKVSSKNPTKSVEKN